MSESAFLLPDPSTLLERAFRRVQLEKMQGLPFLNEALRVEAVGFEPWRTYWLGVVLTPWSMNLTLTSRDAAAWRPLPFGEKRRYNFPAGEFDFISAYVDEVGDYLACSLFSPVLEFADHDTARETARLARAALFDPAEASSADSVSSTGAARTQGPLAELRQSLAKPITRRELLHRPFSRGNDASRG